MTIEAERQEILQGLISDKDIALVFSGTNFGANRDYRSILADTLLKIAGDYSTGYTALCCSEALGLLSRGKRGATLTKKGKRYLFWSFTS